MNAFRFSIPIILFALILTGGCQGARSQPTTDIYATQTQIAQLPTSAPTSTATLTPTDVPNAIVTPFPTLDFVPSGKIYFIRDNNIYSMDGDGKHEALEITGFLEYPHKATWSPDGKQLAFWCENENERANNMIVLCLLDINRLVKNDIAKSLINVKHIHFPIKSNTFWGGYLTIIWSPDGKFILTDYPTTHKVEYAPNEYPCVVELETATVDCSSSNFVMQDLFVDESSGRGSIRGVLQWSPTDADLLAFATINGFNLFDLTQRKLHPIYSADGNIWRDINVPVPIWSPNGTQIAIAYMRHNAISADYPLSSHPTIGIMKLDGSDIQVVLDGLDFYHYVVEQNIRPKLSNFWTTKPPLYRFWIQSWSPDGRFILFSATIEDNLENVNVLARFDTQTGNITPLKVYSASDEAYIMDWLP